MDEVELRDVIKSDLVVFYEHQMDPIACQMAGFASREWQPFLAHWQKILSDPTVINRTILFDGQVVGNIGSFLLDGEREVGYWIDRRYWGRGIATRALRLFLRQVGERPLHARIVLHNTASMRVLLKCGFRITGEEGEEILFERAAEDRPDAMQD